MRNWAAASMKIAVVNPKEKTCCADGLVSLLLLLRLSDERLSFGVWPRVARESRRLLGHDVLFVVLVVNKIEDLFIYAVACNLLVRRKESHSAESRAHRSTPLVASPNRNLSSPPHRSLPRRNRISLLSADFTRRSRERREARSIP